MSLPPAISIRGAVKRFGALTAVDGLDLEVPAGICFGLLGPNGAGKSTTMRMLTAQALPDEGSIEVLGFRLPQESKQARSQMGVCPQLDNLDVELTARQTLEVFSRLYRVPRHERAAAIERALDIANLAERSDTKVSELSGGMRRRLLIGRCLVHEPRLVLLDEPTVGLDPQVRQELWSLIDRLRTSGVTVLMSTHYIEEAERLADVVAVMAAGRSPSARPPTSSPSTPGARRSRSTGHPRGWPRPRRRWPARASRRAAPARPSPSCASTTAVAARLRVSAAPPTWRTCSCS